MLVAPPVATKGHPILKERHMPHFLLKALSHFGPVFWIGTHTLMVLFMAVVMVSNFGWWAVIPVYLLTVTGELSFRARVYFKTVKLMKRIQKMHEQRKQ